jgi:hypothetical protein
MTDETATLSGARARYVLPEALRNDARQPMRGRLGQAILWGFTARSTGGAAKDFSLWPPGIIEMGDV